MTYPTTPPASGSYPLNTAWSPTGGFQNTDFNNTNAVGNYGWRAADSAPVGVRVATMGTEGYTIVSGSVTVINGTTIDGIAVAVNDLVLIKDAPIATGVGSLNSTQPANGIYYVTAVASNISVARAATMSSSSSQPNPAGRVVFVRVGGTVNGGSEFHVTTPFGNAAFTYGTTSMQWTKYVLTPAANEVKTGKVPPARCATVGTETFTILAGAVVTINGTTLDGISPAIGDRILVTSAPASTGVGSSLSSQPANGVYVVTANTTNLSVSRATEMSSTGLITPAGYSIDVMAGTVYGNTQLRVTSPSSGAAFTWGTTAILWGPPNANAKGGTLDGVTIGGTGPSTASPSVNAVTLKNPTGGTVLSGSTQRPWLNQSGFFSGSFTGTGFFNQLIFNDTVAAGTNTMNGLQVTDAVFTPATGLRNGIFGKVEVFSAGTQPQASASYVGVAGRAEILGTLGGTIGTPMGAVWGLWGFGSVNGSTIHAQAMYGAELDVYVASGCTIDYKYGLAIVGVPGDSVRGSVDDILIEACVAPSSTTWKNGIMFGNNQGALAGNAHVTWPFASDSTIIGTCVADGALPANIGIDFSGVTFTSAAIKVGAAAIEANSFKNPSGGTSLSGTQKPWLNQVGSFTGSLTGIGNFNQLIFNDQVVASTGMNGLQVVDNVFSPGVGLRNGIMGKVVVTSAGTQTITQAGYVGVYGRSETGTNLGGTAGTGNGIGEFWGLWGYAAATTGATHMAALYGCELDVTAVAGTSTDRKIGLVIVQAGADAVQGDTYDAAIMVANQSTATTVWKNGIVFGEGSGEWPLGSSSTIIGTYNPGAANIGIDFSGVTFANAAFKAGAAPIELSAMGSPPATPVSGKGVLYLASDGSLHFLGHTTDTQLAPA